jgi:hypothetical protein
MAGERQGKEAGESRWFGAAFRAQPLPLQVANLSLGILLWRRARGAAASPSGS